MNLRHKVLWNNCFFFCFFPFFIGEGVLGLGNIVGLLLYVSSYWNCRFEVRKGEKADEHTYDSQHHKNQSFSFLLQATPLVRHGSVAVGIWAACAHRESSAPLVRSTCSRRGRHGRGCSSSPGRRSPPRTAAALWHEPRRSQDAAEGSECSACPSPISLDTK